MAIAARPQPQRIASNTTRTLRGHCASDVAIQSTSGTASTASKRIGKYTVRPATANATANPSGTSTIGANVHFRTTATKTATPEIATTASGAGANNASAYRPANASAFNGANGCPPSIHPVASAG